MRLLRSALGIFVILGVLSACVVHKYESETGEHEDEHEHEHEHEH